MLKPDKLIQLFYPSFDLAKFINGAQTKVQKLTSTLESSGIKSNSVLENSSHLIFIGAGFFLVMVLMFVASFIFYKIRAKIQSKIKAAVDGFFWNGLIRSVTLAFITQIIACNAQIISFSLTGEEGLPLSAIVIYSILFFYIILTFRILYKHSDELFEKKSLKKRFGELFPKVRPSRQLMVIAYYPTFLLRRFLLLFTLIIFKKQSAFQLQAIIMLDLIYMMIYINCWPLINKAVMLLDVFNSFMLMILIYQMLVFADMFIRQNDSHQIKIYYEIELQMGYAV